MMPLEPRSMRVFACPRRSGGPHPVGDKNIIPIIPPNSRGWRLARGILDGVSNGHFLSTARCLAELRKKNALKPQASSSEVAFDFTDCVASRPCESRSGVGNIGHRPRSRDPVRPETD